jgi:Arc/MetJ-type ribon-helix-helix transcriptional regulator
MTITLAPDLEAIVAEAQRNRGNASQDEVLREALHLLAMMDLEQKEQREDPEYMAYLRREIEKGLEDERQGRVGPWDIEEIKRLGRERLDERKRQAS